VTDRKKRSFRIGAIPAAISLALPVTALGQTDEEVVAGDEVEGSHLTYLGEGHAAPLFSPRK